LRENPNDEVARGRSFSAGKAAPAYQLAKLIIKFIENLADTIDGDPAIRGRSRSCSCPSTTFHSPSG